MNATFRAVAAVAAVALLNGAAVHAQTIEVLTEDPAVAIEAADAVQMDIAQMKFAEPELVVPVGTVVTWTNRDPVPHNVHFSDSDNPGPMLRASQTYSVRFPEAGTFDYICTPHPFMKARVVVE